MLHCFSNNKIQPIIENKIIKISYNNEKCFSCNSNDMIMEEVLEQNVKNHFCKRCNKNVLLYEYISKEKYKQIIEENIKLKDDSITKTNFDNFLKLANI